MKTPIRTARAALLMITALAACASTANAAGQKYDGGYGTQALPAIPGETRLTATKCEALTSNIFAIVGEAGAEKPGARPLSTKFQKTKIAVVRANARARTPWRTVPSGRGEALLASDFSALGNFASVHGLVKESSRARTFIVRKTNTRTGPDKEWKNVTIKLPEPALTTTGTAVNVLNLKDDGLLVVIDRPDAQRIFRFTASGKPANFGTDGVVTNVPTGPAPWYLPSNTATPLLETWDSKIVLAASGRPGQPAADQSTGLLQLDAKGGVVDSFADRGLWTPPTALAEDGPLSGTTKLDAPVTLDVIGGSSPYKRFTVLFGTRTSNEIGSGTKIAAAQLSSKGQQVSISKSFDRGGDGGDGGFPDTLPYTFVPTPEGFNYASAWSQFGGPNEVATYGAIAELDRRLAPPVSTKRFNVNGPFLAYDFAGTRDGKYIYACGAVATSSVSRPWARYAPAMKRFKL